MKDPYPDFKFPKEEPRKHYDEFNCGFIKGLTTAVIYVILLMLLLKVLNIFLFG